MSDDCLLSLQNRYGQALDDVLSARLHGDGDPMFFGMMQYQFGYVDESLQPVISKGGKRFRPLLCLLACDAAGGSWRDALDAAAAIELLHNFSLIHDDIEDRDPARRHRPAIWKLWGEPQAINVGDAVFAEAVRTMLRVHAEAGTCLELARRFGDVVLSLTEGQYMDMSFETRVDVRTDEYLAMIERKTARLIAFSLWAGARLGGALLPSRDAFHAFGLDLGRAFQIHDDILGIWGDPQVTGKEQAVDLRNRKKTLPVLIALERSTGPQHDDLEAFLARENDDLGTVLNILAATGARCASEQHIEEQIAAGRQALRGTGLSPAAVADFEGIAAQLIGQ